MVAKNIVAGLFVIVFINNVFAQNESSIKPLNPGRAIGYINPKEPNYFCEKTYDGKLIKEGFRLNDSVYGQMRLYEQGKLLTIMHFVNEELNGPYIAYFFESGKIYLTGNHKNGKKEGVWEEYDVSGKLISTKKYKNDEQIE